MRRRFLARHIPAIPLSTAIATAVGARILWIAIAGARRGSDAFLVPDSQGYLELATGLARRLEFGGANGMLDTSRTPGYPVLLMPGIYLDAPVQWALALNCILAVVVVAFVFLIARRLAGDRVAGACALVAAVEPTMLAWSLRVMAETALTACVVIFTYCALKAMATHDLRWTGASAAALSAAAYIKLVAWPLVPALTLLALVSRRVSARLVLAFAVVNVAILAPWHIRNYVIAGEPMFSSLISYAVYLGSGAGAVESGDAIAQSASAEQPISPSSPTHAAVARAPRTALTAYAVGVLRTLLDPGATEYFRFLGLYSHGARDAAYHEGLAGVARTFPLLFWVSMLLATALASLIVLAMAGAMRAPPRLRPASVLLGTMALYFVLVAGGWLGTARMRVPVVPLLILLSACAFAPQIDREYVGVAGRDARK